MILDSPAKRRSSTSAVQPISVTGQRRKANWANELADTPGSVPPTRWRPSIYAIRCRMALAVHPRTKRDAYVRCATLLPVGLAVPSQSPETRWSLTPPFHPYSGHCPKRFVFCGAFPRVTPGGCYPPPFPVEPGRSSGHAFACHAAAWPAHSLCNGSTCCELRGCPREDR